MTAIAPGMVVTIVVAAVLLTTHASSSPAAGPAVQSADGAIAARFGVLRAAAAPSDALSSAGEHGNAVETASGANRALARRLTTGTRLNAWLVPARQDTLCMVLRLDQTTSDSGMVCPPISDAHPDIIATLNGGKAGAPRMAPGEVIVVGVVPDGVSQVILGFKDGARRGLKVVDNAFSADVTGPTRSISYVTSEGKAITEEVLSYDE